MAESFTRDLTGAALAYIGDAALEVLVRRYLVGLGVNGSGKLNGMALGFVKATAQSAAVRSASVAREEEEYMYKRGRNASGISAPKSASAGEYRRATGMEALFGYLELAGKRERMEELFFAAYADIIAGA